MAEMDRIERAAQKTDALHRGTLGFGFPICDWKLRGFVSATAMNAVEPFFERFHVELLLGGGAARFFFSERLDFVMGLRTADAGVRGLTGAFQRRLAGQFFGQRKREGQKAE